MLSSQSSNMITADQLVARTIEMSPFQPVTRSTATSSSRVLLAAPQQQQDDDDKVEASGAAAAAGSRWEEHPCDLCKCVLYSMEELSNHINGKRHQKALRNRNWMKAQEVKKLATVNGAHDDEVRLAPPPAAAAGGGSGSGTNAENDNSNPGVPLAAAAAAADGHDDDKYTPVSKLMREHCGEWEVSPMGFKCIICGCSVNSEGCMDMHLMGAGHRKKRESLEWQRRVTTTNNTTSITTTTMLTTPANQQQDVDHQQQQAVVSSNNDPSQDGMWDLSKIPDDERAFIRWDDLRGYVCSCCDAACCTVDTLQMHLRGKKHLSKSRWYKTSTLLHHNGQGVGGDGQVSATTAPAAAATANDDTIGMVIFEDHTIWQETNTGWLCKLCDATVNSDSMAMAHMSSRKHQSNMAWASNTTALPSVDGGGMNNQWYAAGYNEGVEFQNECTYQFYGNRDMPISFGHVDNTGPMGHAPAHNNWEDSRCKLCQTGDICGWAAWSGHFNGKAHKKNVRMNKYEYVAVWQKLSAEGFEYYYDHLTGLWDSHNPVEDEIGYFPDDGIIYVRDPSSFEE